MPISTGGGDSVYSSPTPASSGQPTPTDSTPGLTNTTGGVLAIIGTAKQLTPPPQTTSNVQAGTVSVTSPLTILFPGRATAVANVKRLASYTPTAADVVWVLIQGADMICLGKVA